MIHLVLFHKSTILTGILLSYPNMFLSYRCYVTNRRYVMLLGAQPVCMLSVPRHESGLELIYKCKVMIKVMVKAAVKSSEQIKKGSK